MTRQVYDLGALRKENPCRFSQLCRSHPQAALLSIFAISVHGNSTFPHRPHRSVRRPYWCYVYIYLRIRTLLTAPPTTKTQFSLA